MMAFPLQNVRLSAEQHIADLHLLLSFTKHMTQICSPRNWRFCPYLIFPTYLFYL